MRSTFKVLFYLKKDKHKVQPVVPVMGRITVNVDSDVQRQTSASLPICGR